MKKTIFAGVSVVALGLCAPAMAQDNGSAINQSGDDNSASVSQSREDNGSSVLQDGSSNEASVVQDGKRGFSAVDQTGTNQASLVQGGSTRDAVSVISQNGDANAANVTQRRFLAKMCGRGLLWFVMVRKRRSARKIDPARRTRRHLDPVIVQNMQNTGQRRAYRTGF